MREVCLPTISIPIAEDQRRAGHATRRKVDAMPGMTRLLPTAYHAWRNRAIPLPTTTYDQPLRVVADESPS
jgi:hypothetical protein